MLRISEQMTSDKAATLFLEGEMVGIWVGEVQRSCERLLTAGRHLTLDVSALSYVGHDGIILFHELMSRQVELVRCSPFLHEQLKNGDTLKRLREVRSEDKDRK